MKACKRFLLCLIAAVLALTMFTACDDSDWEDWESWEPSASSASAQPLTPLVAPTAPTVAVGYDISRTAKYVKAFPLQQFYLSMTQTTQTSAKTKTNSLVLAASLSLTESKSYIYDVNEGQIVMNDGKAAYVLDVNNKSGVKVNPVLVDESADDTIAEMLPARTLTFDSGTFTLDGTVYYFERLTQTGSDGKNTYLYYCYDQNDLQGKNLRYYITETDTQREIYKLNELRTVLDPSLFTVPSDYKITNLT